MSTNDNSPIKQGNKSRTRHRLRGMISGKKGKTVGVTSLAVPLLGLIINDLRKPDSLSRQLVYGAVKKLRELKKPKIEMLDITDKVEISELTDHQINNNNNFTKEY
ncbi:MAG: hypothetical protein PHU88_00775 [candidate division Zixibacteria bacterium]|nr:hypothetical protein [candidate division Zixibacteria bacterium]MDD5425783.1 hypothetical protein [candidate division Zixibacteria bacterium]